MRKAISALLLLALLPSLSRAENYFGLGLNVGDTVGGTAKYWFDKLSAVDLVIGDDTGHGNFVTSADYLYHGWKALPQPKSGKLAAYVGGGPRLEFRSDHTEFGLRAVAGTSFWPNNVPLEIYAEIGPLIRMTPDGGVYPVGAVGLRYYFKRWN